MYGECHIDLLHKTHLTSHFAHVYIQNRILNIEREVVHSSDTPEN